VKLFPDRHPRAGISGLFRPALALAAMLALTGCVQSGAGTSAVPDPVDPHPVVQGLQAKGVLDKVSEQAAKSASAVSTAGIGPRMVGPERDMLAASRRLPARLRPAGPATDVDWQRLLVPARTSWPRWFAAVGTAPSRVTPVIWVLSSPDARSPYGLWGELVMLPGAQLPEVARADRGAPELPADTAGLLASPTEVVTRYVDVLTAGPGSRYGKSFAPDVFREQVLRKAAGDRAQLMRLRGTVTSLHTVQGVPLAVRTADGGALVIAALTETYTVRVPAEAGSVRVSDPVVAALAGRTSFTTHVAQTSTELVAFAVPPASAGGKVRVVAAAKAHLSAAGA
jgi:hypothetical protein